jgi:hypothetical protein
MKVIALTELRIPKGLQLGVMAHSGVPVPRSHLGQFLEPLLRTSFDAAENKSWGV